MLGSDSIISDTALRALNVPFRVSPHANLKTLAPVSLLFLETELHAQHRKPKTP